MGNGFFGHAWRHFLWLLDKHDLMGTIQAIAIMVVMPAIGFALGWALSPYGKKFRRRVVAASIVLFILMTMFTFDAETQLSSALLIGSIGFLVAFGYWFRRFLRRFGETPTTFGSSRWANRKDLQDDNVLGDQGIRLGTVDSEPILSLPL